MRTLTPPILFFGTPEFALPSLEALIKNGYTVVGVVTRPDERVGRKQILTPPPVKVIAERHGIPVFQPERLAARDFAAGKSRSRPRNSTSSPHTAKSSLKKSLTSRASEPSTSTPRSSRAGAAPRRFSTRFCTETQRPALPSLRWTSRWTTAALSLRDNAECPIPKSQFPKSLIPNYTISWLNSAQNSLSKYCHDGLQARWHPWRRTNPKRLIPKS